MRFLKPFAAAAALVCLSFTATARAQQRAQRITANVDDSVRLTLPGTHNPRANAARDAGALSPGMKLENMSLVFSRTEAQEADLAQLLGQLQDASSPLYHQWLTPAQFAARFGVADADLAKAEAWLTSQGFQVTGTSNAHDRIFFSGTAAQVEQAFRTELHNFTAADGTKHFAPVGDLSVPAALAGAVRTVANVSSFRPKPHLVRKAATPQFTSAQTGSHFLTPKDLATIYDINPAYNAGYTGSGQTIVVVGQSAVVATDITNFQTAAGVPVRAPSLVLMPGTGTSAVSTGDETESDLDLEYTSGVAKGATIEFVYTGSNQNYGVYDALQYAVDNRLAPIISVSYGSCEGGLSAAEYAQLNAILAEASAQGQTVIAASGDSGSTDCYPETTLSPTIRQSLSADFPSDSQYVTGLGGTMFTAASVAAGSSYWQAASGSDVIGSALSYMPEQVWNNDSAGNLSSGGGGVSVFTARPSWQAGVTGITSGSYRLTPDISLAASPENPGYLYCSSDTQSTGVTGSCANGFRDSSNNYLTVAGGTSFAAPVFAGMLAILNQKLNSTGQGNINPTLYALAANATTYASAFHDITSGSNACAAGATICSAIGASAYTATTGYDSASGLGSVDLYHLMTAWPGATTTTVSTTTLTAATLTPANGASDVVTITVAGAGTTPTGTVSVTVDGTSAGTQTLTAGAAAYTFSSATAGTHTVAATYSGDSNYASSAGSITLTVGAGATKSFALSGTAASITDGGTGTSAITVTPANGYTGTVAFTVTSSATVANLCYTLPSATVAGSTAVASTLTIYTSANACSSTANAVALGKIGVVKSASVRGSSTMELAAFGVLGVLSLAGLRRKLLPVLGVLLLGAFGFTMTGCGSGVTPSATNSTTSTSTYAAKGTYTLTVTGTDTVSSAIASSTTVTLTIN